MPAFALATLRTPVGLDAALCIDCRYHPFARLGAPWAGVSCRLLLADWDTWLPALERLADRLQGEDGLAEGEVELLTPVPDPDKLLAVGANYAGYLKEMGLSVERWDSMPFFMRPPTTTLVGPGPTVRIPRSTRQFDWECELAVFVGRRLRHADRAEAAAAVAGYAVGLDLSCRDLIRVDNELQVDLVRGKAQDTMAPCGPVMVPAACVGDVGDLRITLSVNGETMIDARTSEMLYRVDEQLSIISRYMTLEPGDILFTGSPSGSAGVHSDRWLRDGDRIRAEIERVGVLTVSVHDDT